jgi:hypothetical protein
MVTDRRLIGGIFDQGPYFGRGYYISLKDIYPPRKERGLRYEF